MPGVAPREAAQRQPAPANRTVRPNGFRREVRATRGEATTAAGAKQRRQYGRKEALINADQPEQPEGGNAPHE